MLWTAAWMLRKRWADRADLNRCILRSLAVPADARALSRKPGERSADRVGCSHVLALRPAPSLPRRDHPARDLALSALYPELPSARPNSPGLYGLALPAGRLARKAPRTAVTSVKKGSSPTALARPALRPLARHVPIDGARSQLHDRGESSLLR